MEDEASDRTSPDPIETKLMVLVAPQKRLKTTKAISKQMKNKEGSMCKSQRKKIKLVDMTARLICHKILSFLPVPLPFTEYGKATKPERTGHCIRSVHTLFLEKTSTLAGAFCHLFHHPQPTSAKAN